MPSLVPGFEYDIFISYRQNDNRSGWVTSFVEDLREELAATIKDPVNIYFDENPHDGLLETHEVDKSLEGKLRCLVFIPILSRTYCDEKSFAWTNEFLGFLDKVKKGAGLHVELANHNVASRIIPVQIHDIDDKDQDLFEKKIGAVLRAVDFTFRSPGVSRPLLPQDLRSENLTKTVYRDQINKMAHAIENILTASTGTATPLTRPQALVNPVPVPESRGFMGELMRRNVIRAAYTYLVIALLLLQLLVLLTPTFKIEDRFVSIVTYATLAGFPLAMILAWFYELSPQGVIRTNSAQSMVNPYPAHRKKPLTSWPIVSILYITVLIQTFVIGSKGPAIRPLADAEGNQLISIAVLPFENRSDQADNYIAVGLTDDIISRLTIISQLRVTNRQRVVQYQGQLLAYDEIAKDLEVMTLLTGSVQRSGNQIVVRAQLVEGKTNRFIWANTFQRTTENIIAVQSEIAKVIADKLRIELNDLEKVRLNQKATDNPTAYDFFLRGRNLYYKYEASANDSAIQQFKSAIALDTDYARAWAGLGDAYSQMPSRFSREKYWLDSSMAASRKAIQLDSTLSDAYKALANGLSNRKRYKEAFPLLVKAVALNPTSPQAVGNLGTNYFFQGDYPEALVWEKKSAGLSPKNWIPYQITGWIYRLLGNYGEAESWLEKSLELDPKVYDTYEHLAYTFVAQGRNQDALNLIPRMLDKGQKNDTRILEVAGLISHFAGATKEAKTFFQQSIENNSSYKDDPGTVSPIGLGQILLEGGNRVEAEVYLSHSLEINLNEIKGGSQDDEPPMRIAAVYAIRGNREQSLEWLKKALDANWVDYVQFTHGPWFARYRNDPEFMRVIRPLQDKMAEMKRRAK